MMDSLFAENALKKQRVQVTGFIVVPLGFGEAAGAGAQINAAVTGKKSSKPGFGLCFNQKVEKMRLGSAEEMGKLNPVTHLKNLLKDTRVERVCATKASPKDCPSADVSPDLKNSNQRLNIKHETLSNNSKVRKERTRA